MLENQDLLGVAFFESTALLIILILFLLFRRDNRTRYFRFWIFGWLTLTFSSFAEVVLLLFHAPALQLALVTLQLSAFLLFLASIVHYAFGEQRRLRAALPLSMLLIATAYSIEQAGARQFASIRWPTSIFFCVVCLLSGWLVLRSSAMRRSYGVQLLAGSFLMHGLHGFDRPLWPEHPFIHLRVAFDH